MTTIFDGHRAIDSLGNQGGKHLGGSFQARDGSRTYDSTGAFLVGELERMDLRLNAPLAAVSWGRDIDLRTDVTIADELSSYTLSTFGATGSLGQSQGIGQGKAWVGKNTDQITGINTDISKIVNPLTPWAMEIKYSIMELESAARLGRPIDTQKFEGMQLKYQMDLDAQVYTGDTGLNVTGLFNHSLVTNVSNAVAGASTFTQWASKTPAEILADVNTALTSAWAATGWSVLPSRIMVPPAQFGIISQQVVSSAGSISILRYLMENNILTTAGRGQIEILPCKWLIGMGVGGTVGQLGTVDRLVVYTKDEKYVRFPLAPLQRTPIQYQSLYHQSTYFGRIGAVEMVYPETVCFVDGI
jgi:hypothetical protein